MTDVREGYYREYALAREEACEGKAKRLTETQNEILRFLCGGKTGRRMQGALPLRYTASHLGRMFGCDREDVRGVFEFLERRCLIARRPAPRRGWEWLCGTAREEAVLGQPLAAFGY